MESSLIKLLRCLYVDDDAVIRLEAEEILGENLETLVLAKDGNEGLVKYKNAPFDVVILDISMPGLNGVELSKKIKEIDPKQRIIITSSTEDARFMVELVNIGVNRFFSKPLNFNALLEHLMHTAAYIHNEKRIKEYQELLERKNSELESALEHLKKTQKQLVESEKMASLGALVSGMAHEINTPVGICITAASYMHDKLNSIKKELDSGAIRRSSLDSFFEDANDSCGLLQNNLDRVGQMVQEFKQISTDKHQQEAKSKINILALLECVLIELKQQKEERNITVEVLCDKELEAETLKESFMEVVRALLSNAIFHAYNNNGGCVSMRAQKDGATLLLEIEDNGRGMDEQQLSKIFLPFYKTSGSKGIGLGLSITYNIVTQKFGGNIECKSELGRGTTMIVKIPLG